MLYWKKKRITIRTTEGNDIEVQGKAAGYFVIHKSLHNKKLWTITHAPTGMALVKEVSSRNLCTHIVESISQDVFGFPYMSLDRLKNNVSAITVAMNKAVEDSKG